MPEISRFYGLIILMNFKDHGPPPYWINRLKLFKGNYKESFPGMILQNFQLQEMKMKK
jgi:hypothetical protein